MNAATYAQRKRTRGWQAPVGAISCTRPYSDTGGGRFANPLKIGDMYPAGPAPNDGGYLYKLIETPEDAVEFYRKRLWVWTSTQEAARRELTGKVLMCWCKAGDPCHVQDVLIPFVNEGRL